MSSGLGCTTAGRLDSYHNFPINSQSATRMSNSTSDSFLFENIFDKPLVSRFDSQLRTSDGGASLLGVLDRKTKLTETLCEHLIEVCGRDHLANVVRGEVVDRGRHLELPA